MSTLRVKRRRDMRASRRQFLAVIVTIALGILLFTISYDAYRNLRASYSTTYERLAFADMTVSGVRADFADSAARIEGVARVAMRRSADVPMKVGDSVFIGRVLGPAGTGDRQIDRTDLKAGHNLSASEPTQVVIETHMAKDFSIGVGDAVEILGRDGWIGTEARGVAVSPEYIWPAKSRQDLFPAPRTFGVVFATDDFIDSLPPSDVTTEALVLYDHGAPTSTVDRAVRSAAKAAGAASSTSRSQQASNETLQLDVKGFSQLAIAFPALFLVAAGMATFILLTRIVYSQRPQIGTLRASGFDRGRLTRHYLSYGLSVGALGTAIGLPLGLAGAWATTGVYTDSLGIPDATRQFHPLTPLIAIAFGLLTGALAAWAPTRSALRTTPAEAMRGAAPTTRGSRSVLERLIPPLRHVPVRWLMVLRSLRRSPRRSMSTILGVMLAVVVVLVSWGMIDTTQAFVDQQFEAVDLADATVATITPVTPDVLHEVAAVKGVAAAEPVISLDSSIHGPRGGYSTQLRAFRTNTRMHGFPDGLPTHGLLAGRSIADATGATVGDEVEVELSSLSTSITVPLAGFVDEPMGTYLYMSQAGLDAALAGADPPVRPTALQNPTATTIAVGFEPGVNGDAVISRLRGVPGTVAVIDAKALQKVVSDAMGFFYMFVGVMLVFGGAMAFALIFNTISVNVAERAGELATMRANGLSLRVLGRLVAGENLLLTAMGIPLGLVCGVLVGRWFMSSYSSDLFELPFRVAPLTLVFCSLAMLVVAILSLLPALRTIRKLPIARIVRERNL